MQINLGEAVLYVKADRKQMEAGLAAAHKTTRDVVSKIQRRFDVYFKDR